MKIRFKILIYITILTSFLLTGCSNSNITEISFDADEFKEQEGIELKNNTISITAGGEYNLSGEYNDVQVVVDCKEDVIITLDDLQITNSDMHAIKIKSENTVTIISTGKEQNRISVDGEKNCVKSDGSLIFQGDTALHFHGYDCIKAEEVTFNGGEIIINAVSDGIHTDNIFVNDGRIEINGIGDYTFGIYAEKNVNIYGGSLIIKTPKDGIAADKNVIMDDGYLSIMTDDDGIHADKSVVINGGEINIIGCLEGIESSSISINGGETTIYSINDGLNAANDKKDDDTPANIEITGGRIIINADGDGIDANGSIYLNGGEVFASGAYGGDNNAVDFDHEFIINGGTLLAVGNNLNAKPPSKESLQNSVMIIFDESKFWDYAQLIKDADDNCLIVGQFKKSCDNLIYSSPDLIEGEKYYYTSFQPFYSDPFFIVKPDSLEVYISSENPAGYDDNIFEFFVTSNVTLVWDK